MKWVQTESHDDLHLKNNKAITVTNPQRRIENQP